MEGLKELHNNIITCFLMTYSALAYIIFCIISIILYIYIKHNINTRSIVIFIQKIFCYIILLILVYFSITYNPSILDNNKGFWILLLLSALHTTYKIKPVFFKRDPLPKKNINIIESIKQKYFYFCKNKKDFIIFIFVA